MRLAKVEPVLGKAELARLMALGLTRRQADLYAWLLGYTLKHGYQPSVAEMGQRFGWTSRTGPLSNLRPLEKKGWLRRPDPQQARALRFLRQLDGSPFRGFVCLPAPREGGE